MSSAIDSIKIDSLTLIKKHPLYLNSWALYKYNHFVRFLDKYESSFIDSTIKACGKGVI